MGQGQKQKDQDREVTTITQLRDDGSLGQDGNSEEVKELAECWRYFEYKTDRIS